MENKSFSLYRYRSIDNFEQEFKAIENNYLWFSKFENLNDPMEGSFNRSLLCSSLSKIAASITELENIAKNYSICSLSTKHDNPMLWSLYAGGNTGIAVEYDLRVLSDWLVDEPPFSEVDYSSDIPEFFSNLSEVFDADILAKTMMATKRSEWSHEQEVRLFRKRDKKFHHHPDAIKAIYLGSSFEDTQKLNQFKQLAIRINKPLYKCSIEGYSIISKPLFSPTIIQTRASSKDKKEAKEYGLNHDTELVAQILRLARTDTYCSEIEYIDTSVNFPSQDVIYVSYINKSIEYDDPSEKSVTQKMYFSVSNNEVKRIWGSRNCQRLKKYGL